jgi:16S rRNA (guanine966-N2)-methyltransferase
MSRSTLKTSAQRRNPQAPRRPPSRARLPQQAKRQRPKTSPLPQPPKARARSASSAGQWKRTRLPVAQRPGLRPTPDRVRETLFNWLGQDLSGWRCLDAFAGTGALGFRGRLARRRQRCSWWKATPPWWPSCTPLQQRLQATAVRVQRGDGVAALKQAAPASLDLVLIDPPFDSKLLQPALQAAAQAVAADGFIYLEAPRALERRGAGRRWVWWCTATCKAGAVHAHLLRRASL